jgi:hypothetical protein
VDLLKELEGFRNGWWSRRMARGAGYNRWLRNETIRTRRKRSDSADWTHHLAVIETNGERITTAQSESVFNGRPLNTRIRFGRIFQKLNEFLLSLQRQERRYEISAPPVWLPSRTWLFQTSPKPIPSERGSGLKHALNTSVTKHCDAVSRQIARITLIASF